jgi:hypothetical protein
MRLRLTMLCPLFYCISVLLLFVVPLGSWLQGGILYIISWPVSHLLPNATLMTQIIFSMAEWALVGWTLDQVWLKSHRD